MMRVRQHFDPPTLRDMPAVSEWQQAKASKPSFRPDTALILAL